MIAPDSSLRCAGCAVAEQVARERIIARDVRVESLHGAPPAYVVTSDPRSAHLGGFLRIADAEGLALQIAADEIALAFCDSCRADVDAVVAGRVAV